jgi:hypothetical protein
MVPSWPPARCGSDEPRALVRLPQILCAHGTPLSTFSVFFCVLYPFNPYSKYTHFNTAQTGARDPPHRTRSESLAGWMRGASPSLDIGGAITTITTTIIRMQTPRGARPGLRRAHLGSGRADTSEREAPIHFVNLV